MVEVVREVYLFLHVTARGRPDSYSGGVLGMAFVGTVCSVASSGGINVVGSVLTSNAC